MYVVIEKDYTVSKSNTLTDEIKSRCKNGEISVLNTDDMTGKNLPEYVEEWSEIAEYQSGTQLNDVPEFLTPYEKNCITFLGETFFTGEIEGEQFYPIANQPEEENTFIVESESGLKQKVTFQIEEL